MNKEVQALSDWAEGIGFVNEGTDGRGHYLMRHRTGETYRLAASPSDWRGELNAKSVMRRIAGASNDSPNAGRSRKAVRVSGYTPRKSAAELLASTGAISLRIRWQAAVDEVERLRLYVAEKGRTQATDRACLDALAEKNRTEAQLTNLFQPIPLSPIPGALASD